MKIILDMPKGWMPGCCACCSVPDDAGCRDHGRECPLRDAKDLEEERRAQARADKSSRLDWLKRI